MTIDFVIFWETKRNQETKSSHSLDPFPKTFNSRKQAKPELRAGNSCGPPLGWQGLNGQSRHLLPARMHRGGKLKSRGEREQKARCCTGKCWHPNWWCNNRPNTPPNSRLQYSSPSFSAVLLFMVLLTYNQPQTKKSNRTQHKQVTSFKWHSLHYMFLCY